VSRDRAFTVEDAYRGLKDHYLQPIQEEGPLKAYYLRKWPDSLMMACLIVGTPVGVALMGDLSPGRGIVIRGYSLDWFGEAQEPRYLASKCLSDQIYSEDGAKRDVQEWYEMLLGDAYRERSLPRLKSAKAIKRKIVPGFDKYGWDQHSVYTEMSAIIGGESACTLGVDYDEGDLAWLGAIQRRFSETYQELKTKKEAAGDDQKVSV
jgi:hypothetical protein